MPIIMSYTYEICMILHIYILYDILCAHATGARIYTYKFPTLFLGSFLCPLPWCKAESSANSGWKRI